MKHITFAIPESHVGIANAIARVLDNDVGGDKSFDSVRATDANGVVYAVASSYCSDGFPDLVTALMADLTVLKFRVDEAYADRFPDLTPPSMSECSTFIANALVTENGLEDVGLTLVQQNGI